MRVTRRQLLISAAAVGAAAGLGTVAAGKPVPAHVWRGSALGGEARIVLYGTDPDTARDALAGVAHEIERLEAIFSLFRPESELSRLNAFGVLESPSRDLRDVLGASLRWRAVTGGAFDPTVQTLWTAAANGVDISPALLATAGTAIGLENGVITLSRGTALTLNGIAQGRIADRVAELLVAKGFADVVIDAGELRLPGRRRRSVVVPAVGSALSLAEMAVATSEPRALVFDREGRRHHILDPRTGDSPRHWQSLSVLAPTAQMADALSTGFAVLPPDSVADLAAAVGDVAVIGRDGEGGVRRFGALRLLQ